MQGSPICSAACGRINDDLRHDDVVPDGRSRTAACIAIRRELFEQLGGFDERFVLCGSDAALGIDAVIAGKRNLSPCSLGSGTSSRRSADPCAPEDFFASYWRYQRWVMGGDPYFAQPVAVHPDPELRSLVRAHRGEQMSIPLDASRRSSACRATPRKRPCCRSVPPPTLMFRGVAESPPATVHPFDQLVPPFDIDSPLRRRQHCVASAEHCSVPTASTTVVFWSTPNEIGSSGLRSLPAPVAQDSTSRPRRAARHPRFQADAAVASLWATAYFGRTWGAAQVL